MARGALNVELDAAPYALPEELAGRVITPALAIHLDRVRANVARVVAAAGGPERWRPHVKTAKVPAVLAELARAGVRAFKCATTREADVLLATLAGEGCDDPDVLLAQPLRGPALARAGELAARHPRATLSVLIEDEELARAAPPALSLFADVDLGMRRTGVAVEDGAALLALARAAGARFRGLHGYDGHLPGLAPEERRARAFGCYERLMRAAERLADAGVAVGEVVTSGTPTFLEALRFPGFPGAAAVHRVSPGTVVYSDARTQAELPDLGLVPAAVVHTRVVSHPGPDLVTCDAGSKSVAADAGDPCAVVLGRPDLLVLRPSEEHLPLRAASGRRPARGERLVLFPRHVCTTVNLAEEALLVDGALLVGVVPVSARAHELLWEGPPAR